MLQKEKTFFDKLTGLLGSLKLSFILLILLGILLIQRAIIAQKLIDLEKEPWFVKALHNVGVDSPKALEIPFFIVLGFFALNLVFSSFRMVKKIKAKKEGLKKFRTHDEIKALLNNDEFACPEGAESLLMKFFLSKGFQIRKEDSNKSTRLYAGRRTAGHWGAFFFHMTFFIILIGALLSVMTRQAGYVEISPGDHFIEKRENYLRVTDKPVISVTPAQFSMQLNEIKLSYWRPGEVRQRKSVVSVFDSEGTLLGKRQIAVNKPMKIAGMTVYQGARQGYIADLEAEDSAGTAITGKARFRIPNRTGQKMMSSVHLPGTTLDLTLELFTEKLKAVEGLEPLGAMHMATLMKVTSREGGHSVFQGVIFQGDKLSFEGITMRFLDLRPYTSFVVVRDSGVPVIFTAFVFMLGGLIMTFFWIPEHYWAVIEKGEDGDIVAVGAFTAKYKESFKERFAAEVTELKGKLFK